MKYLRWIDEKLSSAENALLVIFLTVMILLAFLQVVLRSAFDAGITGGDVFLRHLVLLVAFIGAAQAARQEKHITIDILAKLLKDSFKSPIAVVVNAVSLLVVILLAKASWEFVIIEREVGDMAIFGIQTWVYQIIIPAGFLLIGYHFFLHMLEGLVAVYRRERS